MTRLYKKTRKPITVTLKKSTIKRLNEVSKRTNINKSKILEICFLNSDFNVVTNFKIKNDLFVKIHQADKTNHK